jgi:hypothetical protein
VFAVPAVGNQPIGSHCLGRISVGKERIENMMAKAVSMV